ncbi:Regulator_of chromosome condensation 1/beta-lactamase-inhibitor protein II [Hexamita inflata]|uniref:Regulator of chromosome condensation 1/beta-lactamase-inhibitor protein II n=1 Tax=Hexamita inflata TaxID=28002 RepID=A0AA86N713_9EUKA|nr:Regulator of chromosome condensation 1/beta-lactamase-inhibitor protein II [Hexamita inflata]
MIITACLAQAYYVYSDAMQGTMYSQITSQNITDLITCRMANFILTDNGTIMGKGTYKGFLDYSAEFQFINTDIHDVIQIMCTQDKFGYVTKSGKAYLEGSMVQGRITFNQYTAVMPEDVIKILSLGSLTYILTKNGIYAKGDCVNYLCASTNIEYFSDFTRLPIDEIIQNNIKTISFYSHSFVQQQYLFIYLNNGDVWALGNNTNGYLPAPYPDKGVIRKVGNGIRNIQIGYNVTRVEYSLYYMNGTELTVFSRQSNPTTRVIEKNVYDYYSLGTQYRYGQIILIKEQEISNIYEKSTFLRNTEYFCFHNPQDLLCKKLVDQTFSQNTDCPASNIASSPYAVCRIGYCINNQHDKQCVPKVCANTNYTCLALYCGYYEIIDKRLFGEYDPRCYVNYVKSVTTVPLQNAKDYIFLYQSYIMQVSYSELKESCKNQNQNQMSSGGVVGVTIFVCILVFAIVLGVVYILYKKFSQKTQKHKQLNNNKFQTIAI